MANLYANETAVFKIKVASTYEAVAEIQTVSLPELTRGEIESSAIGVTEERVRGQKKVTYGQTDVTGNLDPEDTHHAALSAAAEDGTEIEYQIVVTAASVVKTATLAGKGFISRFKYGEVSEDSTLGFSMTIRNTTKPAFTVA